ncbi:MAG: hypothetical protein WBG69_07140 [Arcobacteraceae bacterium]
MKYFTNSINKFLSATILLTSVNAYALSEDAKEGKVLYLEANCIKCHGIAPKFDSKNNKAKHFEGIKTWVSNCDASLEIGWFPEEQESVAHYLNETHYKHKMK